ncbi:MAG TPA: RhuM family protein [Niabella sp.]|nr:RhuM family protein [Niabella sp.]
MCTLYQKSKSSVSEYLTDIFKKEELDEDSVVRYFRTTAADGKMYNTKFYNLDVIISVGYRADSHRGIQFRKWATQRLKEYLIKGFTLDDERLKSGNQPNYFQELLDQIRDIYPDYSAKKL